MQFYCYLFQKIVDNFNIERESEVRKEEREFLIQYSNSGDLTSLNLIFQNFRGIHFNSSFSILQLIVNFCFI